MAARIRCPLVVPWWSSQKRISTNVKFLRPRVNFATLNRASCARRAATDLASCAGTLGTSCRAPYHLSSATPSRNWLQRWNARATVATARAAENWFNPCFGIQPTYRRSDTLGCRPTVPFRRAQRLPSKIKRMVSPSSSLSRFPTAQLPSLASTPFPPPRLCHTSGHRSAVPA